MKKEVFKMNCYQRTAVLSYFSQLRLNTATDLNYIVGVDTEEGKTVITGESSDYALAVKAVEKNNKVQIELTDINDPRAEYKKLPFYGGIEMKYSDTMDTYMVVEESSASLDPVRVISDTFIPIMNAIIDNAFVALDNMDFIGNQYGFEDCVNLKIMGVKTLDKLLYGVYNGKLTLMAFPKKTVTDNEAIKELTNNILISNNLYSFIDSVRLTNK